MPAIAQETTWTLANSMRSVANPYHASFAKGGEDFAKSIGAKYEMLVTEGNSEKGIADIKALLQRTGGKLILNVDPNDSPDARVIVEEVKKAGGFVVTQWNKPADLHPWDFDPNYVAHMSFDGVPTAEAIANELFKAFGGEGGIVALGGILSNVPAIERKLGLDNAIAKTNGKVTLLDFQPADWNEQKAFDITQAWLTRFGDQVKGVFAANDGMGMGALEALRQNGLAGKVPVVGIDGIERRWRPSRPASSPAPSPGIRCGPAAWAWPFPMPTPPARSTSPRSRRNTANSTAPASSSPRKRSADYKNNPAKIDFNDLWGKATGQIQYRG